MGALSRMGHDPCTGRGVAQIADQLGYIFGEPVAPLHPTSQCMIHRLITAGRTAKAQVDPVTMDRGQCAKLLCNGQGRVVGEHDSPRADADSRCMVSDMPDQYRCRSRCDTWHVVMLCHPVAMVARSLGTLRQINCVCNGLAGI